MVCWVQEPKQDGLPARASEPFANHARMTWQSLCVEGKACTQTQRRHPGPHSAHIDSACKHTSTPARMCAAMKQCSAMDTLPLTWGRTWQQQSHVRPSLTIATIAPAPGLDTAVPEPPKHHDPHVQRTTNKRPTTTEKHSGAKAHKRCVEARTGM